MSEQYIVSARKYRPMRFDEVVGQGHVTQTLKNALKSGHIAHAFLFCGPRGVGKTTCARILAKTLNCENRTADFEPCNECDSCKSMNRNASFNIIEQDGASNNKVEDIRDLVGHVHAAPPKGNYKVFIIDEVHMLSSSAFNAFLKTLEEPPAHAIFILATTEKHKILPTILSRCQIYDFKPIEVENIKSHLAKIAEEEQITAEPEALHLLSEKADGALRDGLSLFDRIVSATDGQVTYEAVIANLNILDHHSYFELSDALLQQDIPTTLQLFDSILRKGFEAELVINGLGNHFRDLMISKDPMTTKLMELGGKIQERYIEQSELFSLSFLLTALQLINECDSTFERARNKRLHAEMTLCKLAMIESVRKAEPFQDASAKKSLSEL